MLAIDLTGKRALVAGVADERGFGFAIAKALAEAGASVAVATWPPLLKAFKLMLARPTSEPALRLANGGKLEFTAIYPFDADYDHLDDVPADVREHRRYSDAGDFSVAGLATAIAAAGHIGQPPHSLFGSAAHPGAAGVIDQPPHSLFGSAAHPGAAGVIDIVVHSLANAPEVKRPLLETSRAGYLAAVSASAYSYVSLVRHLGPIMRPGGAFLALSYLAGSRVIPGYGGGMSTAKAALESDARVLAFEAGRRWRHRVNVISPGPYPSRAAEAIGPIDQMVQYTRRAAPLQTPITAAEVAATATFLVSPLASAITGTVVYVDKGFSAMGVHLEH